MANIIQYVECKKETGLNDWPDCQGDCFKDSKIEGEVNCPVLKRILRDKESGEFEKIDRYTIWPD